LWKTAEIRGFSSERDVSFSMMEANITTSLSEIPDSDAR
jgi:hypothetical protein